MTFAVSDQEDEGSRTMKSLRELRAEVAAEGASRALPIVVGIAAEAAALHRARLAHGSIHAGNVILDGDGGVRLVDALDQPSPIHPDAEVSAAPEQLRGHGATVRSDVYAIGLLAFQLLTGRHPFAGRPWLEQVQAALYEGPQFTPAEERALGPSLVALVRRSVARRPSERFRDASDLLGALGNFAPSAVRVHAAALAPPPPLIDRVRDALAVATARARPLLATAMHRARSLPRWALLGAPCVLIAIAIAAAVASRFSHNARLERDVETLLAAGDADRAAALLARQPRASMSSPTVEKLLGDVSCARGDEEACLQHYKTALDRSSRHSSDERLNRNVLAMLGREERRWLVASVAAEASGIDDELVEATKSEQYWRRWNAVRALEKKGRRRSVDYALVWSLDVLHASSCQTRRAALRKLTELGDKKAVPLLEGARSRNDDCLGEDLQRSIDQLAAR